jgi:hypothetical protein
LLHHLIATVFYNISKQKIMRHSTFFKSLLRKFFLPVFIIVSCCFQTFSQQQPTGLGIVRPTIAAGTTLYLYSGQLIDDLLHHSTVKDSITFGEGQYNIEIKTAPPWFVPEHLKLDYDIFQLRAVTVSRNWIEVIVNTKTGKTAWVDKKAVEFLYWPDFFLKVFNVEVMNGAANPVRIKPLDNASVVLNPGRSSLHPVAVQGEWMKVSTAQESPGAIPKMGWIRWKKGNQLLINWSLLS